MPPPRLILAIEASNPGPSSGEGIAARAGVALGVADGRGRADLVGTEPIRTSTRYQDDLMPAVDRLFRRAGARPGDLGAIAVSIGPGGFTGLRVAVAAAKMISFTTGAACFGVPTSRALIRRVDPALRTARQTAILLAWKREDVWCERYAAGTGLEPASAGSLMRLDGLGLPPGSLLVADTEIIELMRDRGVLPSGAGVVSPRFDAAAVLEASVGFEPISPAELTPLYPREPEAVTRCAMHGGRAEQDA